MAESSDKNEANAQMSQVTGQVTPQVAQTTSTRANDAKQAMAEYEAAAEATRAKTERLRALRLAREAATPAKAPTKRKAATGKKGKASADASSGNLADWLDEQAEEGRRS